MKKQMHVAPVLTLACAGLAAPLHAGNIEVIYTKIPGHPTSVIPGALDANGNPAVTNFRAFHDLIGSPDGSRWLLRGRTQQGSDLENILLLGSGNEGTAFAQEGHPLHGGAPGEVYDFFGSGLGRFNDNNDFAFSARARNGQAGTLQKVIRVIGDNAEIVLQQGDPYIGLQDVPGNVSGDELVGNSVGSVHLLNDGTVGVHDNTIQNLHSSMRPALFYNNITFQQSNVSNFTGIDGKSFEVWIHMNPNRFYTTPATSPISGAERWIAQGRRLGQSFQETVLVVDGQAMLETGSQIPGSSLVVDSISNFNLQSNGDWYCRGNADDGTRVWAVLNGEVFARSDDLVPGGEGERWVNFTQFTGNNNGDWVLIGRTDHVDNTLDDVIVVNGRVVVREGDPVDLSGNGKFDDDVYIGRSNADNASFPGDAFISADGVLYFFASLRDAEGNEYNSDPVFGPPLAFLRLDVDPVDTCEGDLNGDGVVNVSDLLILLGAWGSCTGCDEDLNGDGNVNVSDLLILLSAWGSCE